ncbi:transposase [Alteromonadaceae bacterium 2753L.S.0a.02]|nr:transposase [Alteromonadaceae bacterium 2753L.S.0a.02]TVZ38005.1 transposase [Alteromonadaceae bacterium 2753L.S.0a.02]TVZ38658.1 transposase [Alteromonadaceae bacterium 2753L.S.0a.02]TVZ38697.1 transposase [Alteromonadaceae bacterium 2753L.S.0a.02]TVZ41929.1 transposase [Alteromonadaceae bacterium 2753L.S.0a.02]
MTDAAALQKENALLRAQLAERDAQISVLNEQLKKLFKKRFGASSEKSSPDQLGLFNEAEEVLTDDVAEAEPETTPVKGHTRTQKPRVSIPDNFPREDIIHDIPESEKVCPHDGSTLKNIGSDNHEQLDIVPAKVTVIRHKRLKYACPCCEGHIVTAAKPKQPIEKSIASPGLLAFIAVQKYGDALPLYRQSEMFKRIGIELDRTNMANWMVKCGELVQPLINLLIEHLHKQTYLHVDETPLQVLDEPGKTAQSKSYMWVMAHDGEKPACIFHYAEGRGQQVPVNLLSAENTAIMVDGYEGYQKACNDYGITRLGCWAHARRKFKEAQDLQKKGKTGKADQALAFIRRLYAIEKRIKDEPPDKRFAIRHQEAEPILNKLKDWMEKSLHTVPPKTAIGKALVYLNNQWDRLIAYLEDGRYPIDNNAAERAIRPFTIGRKNWLFSKSQAGAKASANLYSLIETAKANKLNIYDYLTHVFKELPNARSIEDIDALLPWNTILE